MKQFEDLVFFNWDSIASYIVAILLLSLSWFTPSWLRLLSKVLLRGKGKVELDASYGFRLICKTITAIWGLYILMYSVWLSSDQAMPRPMDILGVVGIMITVIAAAEACEQKREIEEIRDSLPTHHLSKFPNHLEDIIDLIGSAKKELLILTDCEDYGSFSHPEAHDKLIEAIKICGVRLKNKSGVEIRICGRPAVLSRSSEFWEKWLDAQYGGQAWEDLLKYEPFRRCLERFCNHNNKGGHDYDFDYDTATPVLFEKLMLKKQDYVKTVLGDYVTIRKPYEDLQYMPSIFFWMIDQQKAVFLLSNTGDETQGIAFYTRDAMIIDILSKTWKYIETANLRGEVKAAEYMSSTDPDAGDLLKFFPREKHKLIDYFVSPYDANRRTRKLWIAFRTSKVICSPKKKPGDNIRLRAQ